MLKILEIDSYFSSFQNKGTGILKQLKKILDFIFLSITSIYNVAWSDHFKKKNARKLPSMLSELVLQGKTFHEKKHTYLQIYHKDIDGVSQISWSYVFTYESKVQCQ